MFTPQIRYAIDEVVGYLIEPAKGGFGYLDSEFAFKDAIFRLKSHLLESNNEQFLDTFI